MTTAICTGEDVRINDIALNRIDDSGSKWILTDLDGWWGLPDSMIPDDPRSISEDGSFYTAGRYLPRVITMSGYIIPGAGGSSAVVQARNTLNRALMLVRETGVLAVDEEPPKMAFVQVVGRPLTRFNDIKNILQFNIQFRAGDPRKYSQEEIVKSNILASTTTNGRTYNKTFNYSYGSASAAGTINAVNEGSYHTFGTFQIRGPITNPIITHQESGKVLQFNILLNPYERLDVDLRNKTVMFNGTASRRTSLDPSSKWFRLEPGNNTIQFAGVQHDLNRDPMIYLTYRSAWME